jgi:hypothetical protein
MCPSEDSLQGYVLPKVQEWVPQHLLLGGRGRRRTPSSTAFCTSDGGLLEFRTYKVDPATLVGADLDYVANDEPSPEPHAKENWWRLIDRNGKMIHALTPVNMTGGGIGWLYRDVYKKREDPNITVIQGAIHDNKHLDAGEVKLTLESATEKEREAREFGRFVHMGGMVYDGGFERVPDEPRPQARRRQGRGTWWSGWTRASRTPPSSGSASTTTTAPTSSMRCCCRRRPRRTTQGDPQDEREVGDTRPALRHRPLRPQPLAHQRRVGRSTAPGRRHLPDARLNAVEAGIQQIRLRMEKRMFFVSPACRGLRDEAEEYRMADRPDGEFKVVKENDHRLDALRYAVTTRLWDPGMDSPEDQPLGWTPDQRPFFSTTSRAAFAARPTRSKPLGLHVLKGTPCASSERRAAFRTPVPSTRSSAGTTRGLRRVRQPDRRPLHPVRVDRRAAGDRQQDPQAGLAPRSELTLAQAENEALKRENEDLKTQLAEADKFAEPPSGP